MTPIGSLPANTPFICQTSRSDVDRSRLEHEIVCLKAALVGSLSANTPSYYQTSRSDVDTGE